MARLLGGLLIPPAGAPEVPETLLQEPSEGHQELRAFGLAGLEDREPTLVDARQPSPVLQLREDPLELPERGPVPWLDRERFQ